MIQKEVFVILIIALIYISVSILIKQFPENFSSIQRIIGGILETTTTSPPTKKFVIDFENASDFEVGLSTPMWNISSNPWHLFQQSPQDGNPIYPKIPNLFEAATDVVHSGKQSARLSLLNATTDRSRRIHIEHSWDPIADKHLWIEGWYYLPSDFQPDNWTDLHRAVTERRWNGTKYEFFQITTGIGSGNYHLWATISSATRPANAAGRIAGYHGGPYGFVDNDGNNVNDLPNAWALTSVNAVPLGKWFKIKTYIYRDMQYGIYKLWLDDKLQWDLHDIRTIGILPERIAEIGDSYGNNKAFITNGFSLYSGDLPNVHPKYAYYDDFVLSSGESDPTTTASTTTTTIPTTTTTTSTTTISSIQTSTSSFIQTTTTSETSTTTIPEQPINKNYYLFVLVGIIVVIAIVVTFIYLKNKGQKVKEEESQEKDEYEKLE